MGEQKVDLMTDQDRMQTFVKNLLRDLQAFEYMLNNDWFETEPMRIGAEQEMFIIDTQTFKPATIAMEALKHLGQYEWAGTELALFNLEINMTPREFVGSCLSDMETETLQYLKIIKEVLRGMKADILLTGILPTLRKFDLELHNLTPKPRYLALMEALNRQLIGNFFELRLMGIDEILVKHNSPLLEACNTSFQVHLQVTPATFVSRYNIAQALAAPVMAMAANSPIVFSKRLWHETRIALFQQALDVRTSHDHMRERSPRVSFGKGWLEKSILEIHREDITRFRVLLGADTEEDALQMIREGVPPKLRALQVHNSTVYRWNRPCYGISDTGKPHLRIENRVLPSGPTVVDEMANAAFWLGAVEGLALQYDDIRKVMSWEDARDNFGKAARYGIDSNFTWFYDKKISACDLALNELIPIAREGLKAKNIVSSDIDKYMGIIEERAKKHMNGARWQLRAFTKLIKEVSRDEAVSVLTASIYANQQNENPVHNWELPNPGDMKNYKPSKLLVDEFMETDLFTVQQDDLIELVAEMMNWRKIRYMPVEDSKGNLVGLITSRLLLRYFTHKFKGEMANQTTVKDIMISNPISIHPNATILEALKIMRANKIGCLPVVQNNELIGIITEMDFLRITGRLVEQLE